MSKFSNFKIKWPKSVEKLENGGRLGPLRQDLHPPPKKKTIRWIRPWRRAVLFIHPPTRHVQWCIEHQPLIRSLPSVVAKKEVTTTTKRNLSADSMDRQQHADVPICEVADSIARSPGHRRRERTPPRPQSSAERRAFPATNVVRNTPRINWTKLSPTGPNWTVPD